MVLPCVPAQLAAFPDGGRPHQLPHVRRSGRRQHVAPRAQARACRRPSRRGGDRRGRRAACVRRFGRAASRHAVFDRRGGRQRSARQARRAKHRRCHASRRPHPFGEFRDHRPPGEGCRLGVGIRQRRVCRTARDRRTRETVGALYREAARRPRKTAGTHRRAVLFAREFRWMARRKKGSKSTKTAS